MSNTLDTPFLSIIIPVFNEEYRLPSSLVKIHDFLIKQSYSFEVIVVENGSSDHTVDVVLESQKNLPYMRLIQTPKRGKGLAVKLGMLAARGQYRFLADADLSMPIQEIIKFLPPQLEKVEVVIGSRELPLSKRFDEPVYRHLIGRGFNTLVRWLTLPGLQDTQCGFKCFSAKAAEKIFPLQTLGGMSFDAEVLFIARHLGFTIREVPINWYFNPDSRVRLVKDSMRMAFDLLTIRRNAKRGLYGQKEI